MLRLRRWQQVASPVLALWFAVFIGESAWLNACPMHGGKAMAAASGAHAMHGGVGQGAAPATAHVAHASVADGAAENDQPQPTPKRSPCNCLGHCIGAAVHALAPAPLRLQLAELHERQQVDASTAQRPAERQEHRLPFATPPPVSPLAA